MRVSQNLFKMALHGDEGSSSGSGGSQGQSGPSEDKSKSPWDK